MSVNGLSNNRTISVVSLISFCIKRFYLVLVLSMICAGTMVAFHVVKVQSQNKNVDTEVILRESTSLRQDINNLNAKINEVNESRLDAIDQYSKGTKCFSEFKAFNDAINGLLNYLTTERNNKEATLSYFESIKKVDYSIPKYLLVGLVCGALVSICFLVVSFSLSNKVCDSSDAEKRLGVPLLGLFFIDNALHDRLARRIIGERKWDTKEEAVAWFKENVSIAVPAGAKVSLLCSRKNKKSKKAVSIVDNTLKENGYTVDIVTDVYQNPLAISSIEKSNGVIIIENQFNSKWTQIEYEVELTDRINKKVFGFVLI